MKVRLEPLWPMCQLIFLSQLLTTPLNKYTGIKTSISAKVNMFKLYLDIVLNVSMVPIILLLDLGVGGRG